MPEPGWTEREQPDMVLRVESAQDERALKLYADQMVRFLSVYSHLADSYVLDFFVADSWCSLPCGWRQCLDGFSAQDLATFISQPPRAIGDASGWPRGAGVAPLSLLCFRACCRSLALSRGPVTSPSTVADFLLRTPCREHSKEKDPSVRSKEWSYTNRTPDAATNLPQLNEVDADPLAKHCQAVPAVSDGSVQSGGSSPAASTLVDAADNSHVPLDGPSASVSETWPADAGAELSPGGGQLKLLDAVFRRCVKPKKQHELRRLARLVELTSPRLVVDLGSGQGHLSRFLAYHCRLQVVCLESNPTFVAGARKLDGTLEKAMQKRKEQTLRRLQRCPESVTSQGGQLDDPLPERPLHSACHITADMDHEKFAQMLCRLTGCEPGALQFSCVGLHTCGDLAALQLRQFVESPHCAAVVSVGCCYMKLSTPPPQRDGEGGWCGYPLSQHVARQSTLCGYHMSYAAREVACHAIEEYAARLRSGGEQQLKIHAYRAALERALVAFDPGLRRAGLRSVLRGHLLTFPEYVERALERQPQRGDGRTQLPAVSAAQLDLSASAADLAQWRRVVVFYSLRLLLAPVVESLILVDRLLYLRQHGHSSVLVAAFDPKMSPRNFVIISKKR